MKINYEKLGAGMYDMLADENRGVIAFGMIPLELMEMATRLMKEKAAKLLCEQWEIENPDQEMLDNFASAIKQEFINEFEKNLTVSILNAAQDAGQLMV